MAELHACSTCRGAGDVCVCRSSVDSSVPIGLVCSLARAWDEGFSAGVKATQDAPGALLIRNPYRQHELHGDCLCERCRPERRRRLGDEAARVEEARIQETAKAIYDNAKTLIGR